MITFMDRVHYERRKKRIKKEANTWTTTARSRQEPGGKVRRNTAAPPAVHWEKHKPAWAPASPSPRSWWRLGWSAPRWGWPASPVACSRTSCWTPSGRSCRRRETSIRALLTSPQTAATLIELKASQSSRGRHSDKYLYSYREQKLSLV